MPTARSRIIAGKFKITGSDAGFYSTPSGWPRFIKIVFDMAKAVATWGRFGRIRSGFKDVSRFDNFKMKTLARHKHGGPNLDYHL